MKSVTFTFAGIVQLTNPQVSEADFERDRRREKLGIRQRQARASSGPMVVMLPPGTKPARKMAERCILSKGRAQL